MKRNFTPDPNPGKWQYRGGQEIDNDESVKSLAPILCLLDTAHLKMAEVRNRPIWQLQKMSQSKLCGETPTEASYLRIPCSGPVSNGKHSTRYITGAKVRQCGIFLSGVRGRVATPRSFGGIYQPRRPQPDWPDCVPRVGAISD